MTLEERCAAVILGYGENDWEDGVLTEACWKHWAWLDERERAAALVLGYTVQSWQSQLAEGEGELDKMSSAWSCTSEHQTLCKRRLPAAFEDDAGADASPASSSSTA